ncbi:MAG: N-acetylgalactosamine-6-phosphate deacetylase [Actinomycetota bacterium]|jgi:N-acetylglucosamine-6-phosphate deacetylase|nr:N-acetylgalactosamine-6-phosphate deacetylase [Actinomycetota bacterium]
MPQAFTIAASTVVTPAGLLEPGEVVVSDGVIEDVRQARGPAPVRILAPGFVDLQVNGHDDVDCASADGDDWDRIDDLLVAQGVTGWCPTLVTAPLDRYAAPLARITGAAARRRPGRPAILGAHLEGPFLGGAPGAHRREHIVPIDLDWLAALPPIVKVVTLAPELEHAADAVRLLTKRHVLVSLGHSTATCEQATEATDAGARLVTHLFNAMGPLHHRRPGLLGAALADDRLTPSLIADGVHVDPAALRVTARAKGPGGWCLVTDAVAWRHGRLAEGRVTMIDGAPRLADGTIAGSALTMDAAVRRMVEEAEVPLDQAIAAATSTPARLLGLGDRGRILPGCRADLVALSTDLRVEEVWIAP